MHAGEIKILQAIFMFPATQGIYADLQLNRGIVWIDKYVSYWEYNRSKLLLNYFKNVDTIRREICVPIIQQGM